MKTLLKTVNFFFSGYLNLIASLASVIGLLLVIFSDQNKTIIALISLLVFEAIIILKFFFVTKRFFLQKTEDGSHKFATYVRYSTDDGKHIFYELHKYIQCKTIIMDEHIHHFYWSGSTDPIITSKLQEFKEFVKTPKGEYDKAIFRFKKPLTYNEFSIVDIGMDLDDSDEKSKTFCEQKVKEKIQLLNFRIELKHYEKHENAKVLRRKLNTPVLQGYEVIEYVKFNEQSRSYEYNVFDPEVGYTYKIEWSRQ